MNCGNTNLNEDITSHKNLIVFGIISNDPNCDYHCDCYSLGGIKSISIGIPFDWHLNTKYQDWRPCMYIAEVGKCRASTRNRAFSLWRQHLRKSIGKERLCIKKEFNSLRVGLEHQYGRRFIDLEHQYQWRIQTFREGGRGGHPDPEIRGAPVSKKTFFGPSSLSLVLK